MSDNPHLQFSKKFELPTHVLRLQAVAQEVQEPHDLANRMRALPGVDDPGVLIARLVATQEILVLRENDAVLCEALRDVLSVRRRDQICIGRRRDVQASQTQSMSDRVVDVLVKMKPDQLMAPPPSMPKRKIGFRSG